MSNNPNLGIFNVQTTPRTIFCPVLDIFLLHYNHKKPQTPQTQIHLHQATTMPRPPPAFTTHHHILTLEDAQRLAASVEAATSLTGQESSMHLPTTTSTASSSITATTSNMFNTTSPSPYLHPPGTRLFSPNISPTNTTLLSARAQPIDTTSPHLRPRFIESGPIDTGMAGAYNYHDDDYEDESEEGEAEDDSDSDDYPAGGWQSEEAQRQRRMAAAAAAGRTLGYVDVETGRSEAMRDMEARIRLRNRERVAAAAAAGAYSVGTLGGQGGVRGGRVQRPQSVQRPAVVWPDARLMTAEELAAYNKKAVAEDREAERKWREEKEKEEKKGGGGPQGSIATAG
ncbi:hypothetical protein DFP73DRAFT_613567 [Morchella snyderi]|nr:hypothetical protein DFP73DRAFT_613567 [Morchella snyderi]